MSAHEPEAPYTPPSPWRRLVGWNAVGLGMLLLAVSVSAASLLDLHRQRYQDDGRKVVRVCHWQLELGFRDALQHVIDDYNRMKAADFAAGRIPAPVEVVQMGVTEKVYNQFINTNLIAGTAPDIIQMGESRTAKGSYKAQYFLPFGDILDRPNPYNAPGLLGEDPALDGELRRVLPTLPWRETFQDGMRSSWDAELQAHYGVPTTFWMGNRLSYNKDLLKAATGSEDPPVTLGQLLETCRKLKAYGRQQGKELIPIAGCRYNGDFWKTYAKSFAAEWQDTLDTDLDGSVDDIEGWAGLAAERVALNQGPYREVMAAVGAISEMFSPGFLAMERDTATFLFIQGKAAMHFTGSWDAGTLARQVKFRMGTTRLPLPGAGEPWGTPAKVAVNEAGGSAGASFGIPKASRNLAEALDFLQYWTSRRVNQQVNANTDWLPVILGCSVSPVMEGFRPNIAGISDKAGWVPGVEGQQMTTLISGQVLKMLTGEATYDQLVVAADAMFQGDNYGWKALFAMSHDTLKATVRANQRSFAGRLLHDRLLPAQADLKARINLAALATDLNGEGRRLLFQRTLAPTGKAFPEVDR